MSMYPQELGTIPEETERVARAESQAHDRQSRRQLRQLSEQLTGVRGS